jgi:hypothetical protein
MSSTLCRTPVLPGAGICRFVSDRSLPDVVMAAMGKAGTSSAPQSLQEEGIVPCITFLDGKPFPRDLSSIPWLMNFFSLTTSQSSRCNRHTGGLANEDISESPDRCPRVYSERTLIRGPTESVGNSCSSGTAQPAVIHRSWLRLLSHPQDSACRGVDARPGGTQGKNRCGGFRYTYRFHCYCHPKGSRKVHIYGFSGDFPRCGLRSFESAAFLE